MDPHDLNRMFERLSPTPEQERAVLDRLFPLERKVSPMKKIKNLAAVLAAAAILTGICAAAAAGIDRTEWPIPSLDRKEYAAPAADIDPRVLDYFSAEPEDAERLSAAVVSAGGSHTYENGWTVQVSQVLFDRYSVMAMIDFIAPDETPLTECTGLSMRELVDEFTLYIDYLVTDPDGTLISSWRAGLRPESAFIGDWDHERVGSAFGSEEYLESSEPEHGCISVMWTCRLNTDGGLLGTTVEIIPRFLEFDLTGEYIPFTTEQEDWSCQITLPETDSGRVYPIQKPLQLGSVEVELSFIYLSPLNLVYEFGHYPGSGGYVVPLYDKDARAYAIHLEDGTAISVKDAFGQRSYAVPKDTVLDSQGRSFTGVDHITLHPEKFINPDEVISFSLFGQTFHLQSET